MLLVAAMILLAFRGGNFGGTRAETRYDCDNFGVLGSEVPYHVTDLLWRKGEEFKSAVGMKIELKLLFCWARCWSLRTVVGGCHCVAAMGIHVGATGTYL